MLCIYPCRVYSPNQTGLVCDGGVLCCVLDKLLEELKKALESFY